MKKYLRTLKRSYFDYRYRKNASDINFYKNILENNPSIQSILIEKDKFVLLLNDGVKFEWNPQEKNSCLGLATTPNYEGFELQIIRQLLKPNDVVFDIGANFGYFSVYIKKFFPEIDMYSFEPIKSTFDLFERNLALNNVTVRSYNSGFSDSNGTVTFYVPEKLGSAWASMGRGVSTVLKYKLTEERCRVQKMDDFVRENAIAKADFIKCDVEGAEKLVIDGGKAFLAETHPILMLEIGDKWSSYFNYTRIDLIKQLLNEFGFNCFGIVNDKLVRLSAPEDALRYSEDILYNYFFIHPLKTEALATLVQQAG